MRYLLDTNICVYIAKRKPPQVFERLRRLRPGDMGMSVVTYFELCYGAEKSQRREENRRRIEELRRLIPVLPVEAEASDHYGRLRAEFERAGTPIGAYDLIIAAQALSLGLVLVTNNVREFKRVRGLSIENWTA
jgi:tRNA(fMet)-specific endonuclease VapC